MKYLVGISIGTTALVLVCSAPGTAQSQDFPNRVVTITIPYAPGGSAEGSLRPVADALSKTWKQPVIIESKGGGGTTIGAGYIAEQTPDGYRLLFTALSAHTIAPNMFSGLKYDAVKSFTPISGVATSPYLILVNASSPVRTIAELIAHAKANPGKVNYGSSGAGTGPHLSGEILKQAVGIETVHVSFRGAAPAITALLGNHLDYLVTDISGLPLVQAGQLRALAVTSLERSPYLPETPTVHETVDKGFEGINRVALMGPAGMDPKLTATIMEAVHKALADRRGQESLPAAGLHPLPIDQRTIGAVHAIGTPTNSPKSSARSE